MSPLKSELGKARFAETQHSEAFQRAKKKDGSKASGARLDKSGLAGAYLSVRDCEARLGSKRSSATLFSRRLATRNRSHKCHKKHNKPDWRDYETEDYGGYPQTANA